MVMKDGESVTFILTKVAGEFWLGSEQLVPAKIAGLRPQRVILSEVYASRRALMTRIGRLLND